MRIDPRDSSLLSAMPAWSTVSQPGFSARHAENDSVLAYWYLRDTTLASKGGSRASTENFYLSFQMRIRGPGRLTLEICLNGT